MSWTLVTWLIVTLLVLVEPIVLFWAIVRFGWRPFEQAHPAQPVHEDAVARNFQSFSIGLLNLGFAIHAAADERHLHLTPVALLRWFGAGTVSIPWEAIKVQKRSRRGNWIVAKVGNRTIRGPAWCLGLAEPAEAADESAG